MPTQLTSNGLSFSAPHPRQRRQRGITSLALISLLAPMLVVGTAGVAAAATPLFQLPFPCGEVWDGATRTDHPSEGVVLPYALDFNLHGGANDLNEEVVASAAGHATRLGSLEEARGYYIEIDHGGGWTTRYAHLQSYALSSDGDVQMGDVIGYVGDTGTASKGSHLHFGLEHNGTEMPIAFNGVPIDYDPQSNPGLYNRPGPAFTSYNCGGGGGASHTLAPGDFNGDYFADLMTIADDGTLYLHPGNGTGGFRREDGVIIGRGWDGFKDVLAPGDFTGDYRPDLIAVTTEGALRVYPGDGAGGFLPPYNVGSGFQDYKTVIAPGDFTGDFDADLIGVGTNGALHVHPGNGTGGLEPRLAPYGSDFERLRKVVAAGDLDGDYRADLLAVGVDGSLWLHRGDGAGKTLPASSIGQGWSGMTDVVGVGDFDGDWNDDVVAVNAVGTMLLFPGNGAGVLETAVPIRTNWATRTLLAPGDLDGDGYADLLSYGTDDGRLYLHSGDGAGGFGAGTLIGSGWNVYKNVITPGDFTGDGNSDLIGVADDGRLYLHRGNGAGGSALRTRSAPTGRRSRAPSHPVTSTAMARPTS